MEMTKVVRSFMVLSLFAALPFVAFARNGEEVESTDSIISEEVEAPETQTREEAMLELNSEAEQDGGYERPRDGY